MQCLTQDVLDDRSMDIGEAVITPTITVGECRVIETHEMQDRCMEIVHVDSIFHGRQAEFIRGTIAHTWLDTSAGHPDGKTVMIVITSFLPL